MTYPKQAITKITKDIIETFGGSKYRDYTLDSMKSKIKEISKKGFDDYKAETGKPLTGNVYSNLFNLTIRMCDNLKSVESVLTKITEYYFSLTE